MEKQILELNDILDCIELWFKNEPGYRETFCGPCLAEDMDDLVELSERELPSEFVQLYQRFDGADVKDDVGDDSKTLFEFFFMSLGGIDGVVREYETFEDVDYSSDFLACEGPIKSMSCNQHWVPFEKDFAGNFIGIDLDPPESGRYGQVIKFGADEVPSVLAPSIAAYLMERCKIAGIPLPDPASKPKYKRHEKQSELKSNSEANTKTKTRSKTVKSETKLSEIPIIHDPASNVFSIFSARSRRNARSTAEESVETVTIIENDNGEDDSNN